MSMSRGFDLANWINSKCTNCSSSKRIKFLFASHVIQVCPECLIVEITKEGEKDEQQQETKLGRVLL